MKPNTANNAMNRFKSLPSRERGLKPGIPWAPSAPCAPSLPSRERGLKHEEDITPELEEKRRSLRGSVD